MNCKQDDLAVIVRSKYGNEGKIVTCLRRYDGPWIDREYEPGWLTDTFIQRPSGKPGPYIFDASLRPIRDQDGQDETLTWLDVPSKEIT